MKIKVILCLIFILYTQSIAFTLKSGAFSATVNQQGDTLIKLTGKVVDQTSGNPVTASIFYEKLPYYDDMGAAKSSAEGIFEVYLLKNRSYILQVRAAGFDPISEEFIVEPDAGSAELSKEFVLTPDKSNQMIVLENLIFERGRSKISSSSFEELDRLVDWLNERPNMIIQLEGHTDFEGNASANLQLSQERVDAVKEYVVSKGVKKARVLTKAFGGTQPLSLERTDEAKRKNRRVEVRVIKE